MEEIWKDVTIEHKGVSYNFNGLYQVSNLGRVKSLNYKRTNKEKLLKTKANKEGYHQVILCKDGKHIPVYVHRLVATAFIDNPNNYSLVNHKDENPSNNVWTNLEWCTVQYNTKYSRYKYKGNATNHPTGSEAFNTRKVLCVETGQVFSTVKEAQAWLGKGCVCDCARGRSKTAGGYHWQYVDDTDE